MKKVILSSLVTAGILFSGCSMVSPETPLTKDKVESNNGVVNFNIDLQKPVKSDVPYQGVIWIANLGSDKTKKAIFNSKEIQLPAGKYQINVIGVRNNATNRFVATNALYFIAKKYHNPIEIDVAAGKENCFNTKIQVGEKIQNAFITKFVINWIEKANANTQCRANGKYIFPINNNTPKISLEMGFDKAVGLGYVKITKNGKSNIYYTAGVGKDLIEQKAVLGKVIPGNLRKEFVNYINKNVVIEQNEFINKYLNGQAPAGIVK